MPAMPQHTHSTMGIDAKRDTAWSEYGFKEEITYDDLYKLYRRGGIAHGAVEKIVTTCWRTKPKMIEGTEDEKAKKETPWEREIKKKFNNRFWRTVAECDRRRPIGRYAGLLIHVEITSRGSASDKRRRYCQIYPGMGWRSYTEGVRRRPEQ